MRGLVKKRDKKKHQKEMLVLLECYWDVQKEIDFLMTICHKNTKAENQIFYFMGLKARIEGQIAFNCPDHWDIYKLPSLEEARAYYRINNHPVVFLVPSKHREEIIGDLIETRYKMQVQGLPKLVVAVIMAFRILGVIYSIRNISLEDLGTRVRTK